MLVFCAWLIKAQWLMLLGLLEYSAPGRQGEGGTNINAGAGHCGGVPRILLSRRIWGICRGGGCGVVVWWCGTMDVGGGERRRDAGKLKISAIVDGGSQDSQLEPSSLPVQVPTSLS